MSKAKEAMRDQMLKDQNYLNEAAEKVRAGVAEIEKELEAKIIARIEPIGPPTIGVVVKKTVIVTGEGNEKQATDDKVNLVNAKYKALYDSFGIFPQAQIGNFGAAIGYHLTDKKRHELSGVVPNSPSLPKPPEVK